MEQIKQALAKGTALLQKLTAATMSAGHLAELTRDFQQLDIPGLLSGHPAEKPGEEMDEADKEKRRQQQENLADSLNKAADPFKDELERVKKLREDTKQEALDPVIAAAQEQIRVLYRYTANLES